MFAPLPHAVNFFSKPSDQYYIAVAFPYLNMLQAVQFVQYTVTQNKYSPQTNNVAFDGSCSRKKTKPPRSCSNFMQGAYHYVSQIA